MERVGPEQRGAAPAHCASRRGGGFPIQKYERLTEGESAVCQEWEAQLSAFSCRIFFLNPAVEIKGRM